jgi:ketosteroid isomerase-like protein
MTNRDVVAVLMVAIVFAGGGTGAADGRERTTTEATEFAAEMSHAVGQNVTAQATVAALDIQYQAAVKANDAAAMDRILADDFVLVTGRGQAFKKAEEEPGSQTVRVWGDTAVVTALLWIKGTRAGAPIDYKLWFSDTYVRTAGSWKYAFGQASIALPKGVP